MWVVNYRPYAGRRCLRKVCNFLPGYLVQYTLIFIVPAIRVSNRALLLFLQVNIALTATSVPDSQPTIDLCRRELWVTCQAYSMAATRIACVFVLHHELYSTAETARTTPCTSVKWFHTVVTQCVSQYVQTLRRLKSDRKRKHNATCKSISITHFKLCVFVALFTQNAKRMRRIILSIYGLSGSTKFVHIITWTARPSRKESYWTQNVCFDFLYKFCLKHFTFYE